MVYKALFLKHSKRTLILGNFGLYSQSHAKTRPIKLDYRIHIRRSDLNLLSLKKEVKMRSLKAIKDHNPSLTQVNC